VNFVKITLVQKGWSVISIGSKWRK